MLSCFAAAADEDAIVNASSRTALVGAACWLFAACSATGYRISDLASEINATRDSARTVVAIGDSIKVTFPYKVDWNHETRVRADGYAAFLMLDDVPVAGLSTEELDKRLTELYLAKEQKAAPLTVDVVSAGGGGAAVSPDSLFVVGEVEHPGPIATSARPLTLFEAIAAAGGHRKSTANLRNVILVRRLGKTGEMRSWRLDADIYRWGNEPPIYLQPRDILFVPNTAIDDVDIWVDKYIRQLIPLPTLVPPA